MVGFSNGNLCVILEEARQWGSGALSSGSGIAAALLAVSHQVVVEHLWAQILYVHGKRGFTSSKFGLGQIFCSIDCTKHCSKQNETEKALISV